MQLLFVHLFDYSDNDAIHDILPTHGFVGIQLVSTADVSEDCFNVGSRDTS